MPSSSDTSEANTLEVIVELSLTERKLAEGTVGLGAQVCFIRKHDLGAWVKMTGEIRLMTERNKKHYAVVTLQS